MKKEDVYKQIKEYIDNSEGFIKHNKMHVETIDDEKCKMYIDVTPKSLNPSQIVHGGLLFGLADTAMGVLARTTGRNVITINAQIDYLKASKGNRIYCVAEPLKIGKTTAVYRASIFDEKEKLTATVTGTYMFID